MRCAARAPVKPRYVSAETGVNLPVEDEIESLLDRRGPAIVRLVGCPGSGKTMALDHLAAVFPQTPRLRLLDNVKDLKDLKPAGDDVIVFAGSARPFGLAVQTLHLAWWGRDEWIEYLLSRHPQQCGSVLARISSEDEDEISGVPELWTAILEQLATDATLTDPSRALLRYLRSLMPAEKSWKALGSACFLKDWRSESDSVEAVEFAKFVPSELVRMLEHAPARVLVAAEFVAAGLIDISDPLILSARISRLLIRAVAERIRSSAAARERLEVAVVFPAQQSVAASLLHAIDPAWRPIQKRRLFLSGAYLDDVSWRKATMSRSCLRDASFCHADLTGADLRWVDAQDAFFREACLADAQLLQFVGSGADFTGADLSSIRAGSANFESAKLAHANLTDARLAGAMFGHADLRSASLRQANLHRADLFRASLEDTDFREAILTEADLSDLDLRRCRLAGARLARAVLRKANLEDMRLEGIDLQGAHLERAVLTGSSMKGCNLAHCHLNEAGLADVEWEGVSLRGANLTGASFHMGSSRSGLVGSPYVSEGTRTGFYTDDYDDQDFKTPEEIRKANLCKADLRDAEVTGADFYLVDLRGAIFDSRQLEHFRRCGAILEDRCP